MDVTKNRPRTITVMQLLRSNDDGRSKETTLATRLIQVNGNCKVYLVHQDSGIKVDGLQCQTLVVTGNDEATCVPAKTPRTEPQYISRTQLITVGK